MPNVFISYVRENAAIVDKLAAELRQHGVTVWLDREQLMPGMRWQQAIRKAIRSGDYFIACFSAESVARSRTYQNEELVLAIEELRLRPADRIWFIPVLLSECKVPDRDIGGGETLDSIQWVVLYQNWEEGVGRILKAMGIQRELVPVRPLASDLWTFRDPINLEMVFIPPGEFLMGGNPSNDSQEWSDAMPQRHLHQMEFYIARYPIINAQYAIFVKATGYRAPDHWKEGKIPAGKEAHPVVYVSWKDALAFCEWITQATGWSLSLPTEAQWEKAAAWNAAKEQKRKYPWGDEFDAKKCNTEESGIGDTTPVGKYSPVGDSPYGIADMSGNVWEWTSTLYRHYPYNPWDGREDLTLSGERVIRGGSWNENNDCGATSFRVVSDPDNRVDNLGFRVVAFVRLTD